MSVVRTALYMLLMALVVAWVSFYAMPLAIRWEFSPAVVDQFPKAGLGLGAALGLAMGFSEALRHSVWFLFATLLIGWLVWFFLVLAAGLGVTLVLEGEAFEQVMEKVDTVATWIAICVTAACIAAGAYAIVYDKADALLGRLRTKSRNSRGPEKS
jgi:hypothetical protein